jgi:hypothetical protein
MTMAGTFSDGTYAFQRHRCKGYNCGVCGDKKMRLVRQRITQLAAEKGLRRMVTLTLDPKKLANPNESIPYIRDCWRKMRVYLKRRCKRSVAFISVLELQPNSGLAHLHVLVDAYIPKEFLSTAWAAVGGGFTNIRAVDVHRISSYIAKYFTKPGVRDIEDGIRRFTCSRGLTLWPRPATDGEWELLRTEIDQVRSRVANVTGEKHETEADGTVVLIWFTSSEYPSSTSAHAVAYGPAYGQPQGEPA